MFHLPTTHTGCPWETSVSACSLQWLVLLAGLNTCIGDHLIKLSDKSVDVYSQLMESQSGRFTFTHTSFFHPHMYKDHSNLLHKVIIRIMIKQTCQGLILALPQGIHNSSSYCHCILEKQNKTSKIIQLSHYFWAIIIFL